MSTSSKSIPKFNEAVLLTSSIPVPNDVSTSTQLGQGYNTLRFESVNNVALDQSSLGNVITNTANSTKYSITVCNTQEELNAALGFSLAAEGSYLGAKVGGSISGAYSLKMKATTIAVVAQVQVTTQISSLDLSKIALSSTAQEVLGDGSQQDLINFFNEFGDYYCGSQVFGGFLDAVFFFETMDLSEKASLSASLSVDAKTATTKADFDASLESMSSLSSASFNLYSIGGESFGEYFRGTPGEIGNQPVMNWQNVLQYAIAFPATVNPSTQSIIINNYNLMSQITDFAGNLDSVLDTATYNVAQLSQLVADYEEAATDINYALAMDSDYDLPADIIADLESWSTEIAGYITILKDAWSQSDPTNIQSPEQVLPEGYNPPSYYQDQFNDLNLESMAVLNYGDAFYLGTTTSNYIARAISSRGKHFPTYGRSSKATLFMQYAQDPSSTAEPQDDDSVFLLSTNSVLGESNYMGAWNKKDLYYYASDYPENETWTIRKAVKTVDNIIRYGDQVYLCNHYYDDEYLSPNGKYLTTSENEQVWVVMRTTS